MKLFVFLRHINISRYYDVGPPAAPLNLKFLFRRLFLPDAVAPSRVVCGEMFSNV